MLSLLYGPTLTSYITKPWDFLLPRKCHYTSLQYKFYVDRTTNKPKWLPLVDAFGTSSMSSWLTLMSPADLSNRQQWLPTYLSEGFLTTTAPNETGKGYKCWGINIPGVLSTFNREDLLNLKFLTVRVCVCVCVCVCVLSHFSCVCLFAIIWTVAHQAPLPMVFSRQEYWSGLQCPPPGDLSHPGIEPTCFMSSALAGRFFTTSTTREAQHVPCHL